MLGAAAPAEFIGLDQVNIGPLPRSLAGRGEVGVVLTVDGRTANMVMVNIQEGFDVQIDDPDLTFPKVSLRGSLRIMRTCGPEETRSFAR